tara:strand:- start:4091 stop:4561 length:471 start_codon:yes stop_codon:yes gene_type:complete
MAATSTNKQPLLVDRVLHYVVDLNTAAVSTIDVSGTNTALLIVDATSTDGAIIEDIYAISRSTSEETINLYISGASDYLRPNEGTFIGQFKSATTIGQHQSWEGMPKILAPMPQVGSTDNQFRALYIPKGRALWAARQSDAVVANGPLLGCQGGWY